MIFLYKSVSYMFLHIYEYIIYEFSFFTSVNLNLHNVMIFSWLQLL